MLQARIDFVTVIINLIHPPLISHYTQKRSLNQPFSTHILTVPKMNWFHLEFFHMTRSNGYLDNQSAQFQLGRKQVTWVFSHLNKGAVLGGLAQLQADEVPWGRQVQVSTLSKYTYWMHFYLGCFPLIMGLSGCNTIWSWRASVLASASLNDSIHNSWRTWEEPQTLKTAEAWYVWAEYLCILGRSRFPGSRSPAPNLLATPFSRAPFRSVRF